MYQRALTGKEKALCPEHRSTLDTVNNSPALDLSMPLASISERSRQSGSGLEFVSVELSIGSVVSSN